jgi:hypothetical protein
MKHCDKCKVDVRSNKKYCPLCHQKLQGDSEPDFKEVYPEFVPLRREVLPITKKALLVVTIVSILTLLLLNFVVFTGTYWSLIPIGTTAYFWLVVRYGLLTKQNVAFRIAFLTTILIVVLNLLDQNAGLEENRGWALNYFTPLALFSCNLAISFIIWIKRINYRDYMFYLMTILVFSLVPLVLFLFGVITIAYPSIISFSGAIFILLVIIFFFPKSIKDEIKKRFHL